MRALFTASLVMLCGMAEPALAQTAKLLQKYSGWSAYVTEGGGSKVCFVVAQPTEKKPKNVKRDPAYFYVSSWPGDGVKNEISVKIGYPFKAGATVTATVAGQKFTLFTKEEGAFIEKADVESKMVQALGKGGGMTIQGRSQRGTVTIDEYSLDGAKDALDRITQECP